MKNIAKIFNWLILSIFLHLFFQLNSQSPFYLNHFIQSTNEHKYIETFVSLKPLKNQLFTTQDTSSTNSTKISIFTNNNIQLNYKNLKINFNLLADLSQTTIKDTSSNYSQNTRGFNIFGTLGKNIFFYTEFFENQVYLVPYLDQKTNQTLTLLGQGVWKTFGTEQKSKDYNYATGFLWWKINKKFNIQAGQSKLFYGFGYRSLLLSDNASPFPFFRINADLAKFQYNVIYSELENFQTKYYFVHKKKHATFIIINYKPTKFIEIGFFESTLWQTSDFATYRNRFPFLFFVPIPVAKELVYGLNNKHNINLGLNIGFYFKNYATFYTQTVLDNFSKDSFNQRFGIQTGIKIYDLFLYKIPQTQLYIQTEYNTCRPYTYTSNLANMSYTHLNEALATPLGADFKEFLFISHFKFHRFSMSFQFNNITSSIDTNTSNNGSNILLINTNATNTQPNAIANQLQTKIKYLSAQIAFTINKTNNLQIFTEINQRSLNNIFENKKNIFITFGLKNRIKNTYKDF